MGFPEWIPTLVMGSCLMLGLLGFQRWNPLPGLVLTRPRIAFKPKTQEAPAAKATPRHPPIHKTLSAQMATRLFLEWLAESWEETFLSASQVDDCWHTFARNRGIYPINAGLIRGEMTALNLCLGPRRLKAPEFLHIKHALDRDRAVIYRRPTLQQLKARDECLASGEPEDGRLLVGFESDPNRQASGKRRPGAKGTPRKRQLPEIPQDHDSFRRAA
jgi:hypothetical protein